MRPDALPPSDSRLRRRSFRGGRGAAIDIGLILLVAALALWIDRKPIAQGYITRTLADARVPAHYTLAALGPGRQRLTDVVVGDPARPDLVADWIETETSIGLGGVRLTGVRAGHVRLRATLANGHVSLGAIDRLLPASTGAPFALPAIDLAIADGRMRLATTAGVVGLKLAGSGRVDDGFSGTVAAVADRGGGRWLRRDAACGGVARCGAIGKTGADRSGARGQCRLRRRACARGGSDNSMRRWRPIWRAGPAGRC